MHNPVQIAFGLTFESVSRPVQTPLEQQFIMCLVASLCCGQVVSGSTCAAEEFQGGPPNVSSLLRLLPTGPSGGQCRPVLLQEESACQLQVEVDGLVHVSTV